MNFKLENKTLLIFLPERIDTNNALQVEEEIKIVTSSNEYDNLVFDAKKLEYISSAGLRIILKFKKLNDSLEIINASNDTYDIFEVTGFTEIISIKRKMKEMNLDNAVKIGEGAKGIVYRYSDEVIVKVYKNTDCLDEINREHELARKAFVLGIPTAISFEAVKVGDKYGSVFELLEAKSVTEAIIENKNDLEKYAILSSNLLKQIHATSLKDNDLPDIALKMEKRVARLESKLTKEEHHKLLGMINSIPRTNNLIHGDFHTNNIMLEQGEIRLIDMDTLAMGNPIFELANVYTAYVAFGIFDPKKIEDFFKLDLESLRKFYDIFIRNYLPGYNDEIENKLKLLSYIRFYNHIVKRDGDNSESAKLLEYIKELLTKVDNLVL